MKKIIVCLLILTVASDLACAQSSPLLIPYRSGKKWGYCDTLGNIKIAPGRFDYAEIFSELNQIKPEAQVALVSDNHNLYAIDTKGNRISPDGTDIKPVQVNNEVYLIIRDKKTSLYAVYKNMKRLTAGYTEIKAMENKAFLLVKDELAGVADKDGKIIIPINYSRIAFIKRAHAYYLLKEDKHGLADEKGKIIIPAEFSDISLDKELSDDNQNIWYAWSYEEDNSRKKFIQKLYPEKEKINNDLSTERIVELRSDDRGSDKTFKKELKQKLQLDSIYIIAENKLAFIVKDEHPGVLVDDSVLYFLQKDDSIVDIKFIEKNTLEYSKHPGSAFIILQRGDKIGVINEKQEIILPFEFDMISDLDNNTLDLVKGKKYGKYTMSTYYPYIPPKYESIHLSEHLSVNSGWRFNLYRVQTEKGDGYVGENGIEYFRD